MKKKKRKRSIIRTRAKLRELLEKRIIPAVITGLIFMVMLIVALVLGYRFSSPVNLSLILLVIIVCCGSSIFMAAEWITQKLLENMIFRFVDWVVKEPWNSKKVSMANTLDDGKLLWMYTKLWAHSETHKIKPLLISIKVRIQKLLQGKLTFVSWRAVFVFWKNSYLRIDFHLKMNKALPLNKNGMNTKMKRKIKKNIKVPFLLFKMALPFLLYSGIWIVVSGFFYKIGILTTKWQMVFLCLAFYISYKELFLPLWRKIFGGNGLSYLW